MKTLLLNMLTSMMSVAGQMVETASTTEPNPATAKEEAVIGKVLTSGGKAIASLLAGNVQDVGADLKVLADGIYDYLGLTHA